VIFSAVVHWHGRRFTQPFALMAEVFTKRWPNVAGAKNRPVHFYFPKATSLKGLSGRHFEIYSKGRRRVTATRHLSAQFEIADMTEMEHHIKARTGPVCLSERACPPGYWPRWAADGPVHKLTCGYTAAAIRQLVLVLSLYLDFSHVWSLSTGLEHGSIFWIG